MKKVSTKLVVLAAALTLVAGMIAGCGGASNETPAPAGSSAAPAGSAAVGNADQEAANAVDELIAGIQVQEWTEGNDERCAEAKAAYDKLTDAQKELMEEADYFGRDTGDASQDDPLNGDEIGEKEILVVSFGTSFNQSRTMDIGSIERAIQAAFPDWSVRRAFTAQIIINHILARDGVKIDNIQQALERAVANGVKQLVVQPTHLMHGAEYDEVAAAVEEYKDKFDSVVIAEPLLGEVGADATAINADKEAVAKAVVDAALAEHGGVEKADADGTALVLMGHGTSHVANVTYNQMQAQMEQLGYKNVFIGTVEGEPEDTAVDVVIGKVKDAGYKNVILRPLMVVAGDHANNDMADEEDPESWYSQFTASGNFDSVSCDVRGLGRIEEVDGLYVVHTQAAIQGMQ